MGSYATVSSRAICDLTLRAIDDNLFASRENLACHRASSLISSRIIAAIASCSLSGNFYTSWTARSNIAFIVRPRFQSIRSIVGAFAPTVRHPGDGQGRALQQDRTAVWHNLVQPSGNRREDPILCGNRQGLGCKKFSNAA